MAYEIIPNRKLSAVRSQSTVKQREYVITNTEVTFYLIVPWSPGVSSVHVACTELTDICKVTLLFIMNH